MANVILYNQLGYRPFIWRTISCYLLARWIEEHGYTCQVIEFTHLFSPEELYEYTEMFIDNSTLMIGASSNMWTSWSSELMMNVFTKSVPENIHKALKEVKNKYPNISTVIGGHRAYTDFSGIEIFDFQCIKDFGEDWLLKLLDELSKTPLRDRLTRQNFDFDNHRFVFRDHDCILPNESLPIEWGRGCIFKCPFCRSPKLGKKSGAYEKSIDLMVDTLTEVFEKFGTTSFYFIDETFNADYERVKNLHKVAERLPFKLEFSCYNRADLIDKHPDTIDLLQESGLRSTLFGIETFNPEASKLVLKPWSSKRAKDFLPELRSKWHKVHIDCSLIAGLPGVTKEEHYSIADWFLNSGIDFFNFKPLVMVKDAHSTKSTWEVDASKLRIEWIDDEDPFQWRWGDTTYRDSFILSSELNRYVKTNERIFSWSVPAYTVFGLKIDEVVNNKIVNIIDKVGDLYDLEQNIFEEYKSRLKLLRGR